MNFIPTPLRITSILHLCIVFTLIFSILSYPFMGELFTIKSKALIVESVLDHSSFSNLPEMEKESIKSYYETLNKKKGSTFLEKITIAIKTLLAGASPYLLSWIFLSILVPLFLLLRVNGGSELVWLLPLLVALCSYENHQKPYTLTHEMKLFPSEEILIKDYMTDPFSTAISEQQKQLKEAWNAYLLKNWGGEFAFQLKRVEALQKDGIPTPIQVLNEKTSPILFFIYFSWNLFFAALSTFYRNKPILQLQKERL